MGLFGEEVSGERAVELGLAWAAHDDEHVEREAHTRGPRGRGPSSRRLSAASGARPCPAESHGTSPWARALAADVVAAAQARSVDWPVTPAPEA